MQALALAFSIFLTNPQGDISPPTGIKAPYLPAGQVTAPVYQTKEECENELSDVRSDNNDAIARIEGGGLSNAMISTIKRRNDSLMCLPADSQKADHAEVATAATAQKPTDLADDSKELADVWKIGRFDQDQVFRGTKEDLTTYLSKKECLKGKDRVRRRLVSEGQDMRGLDKFDLTYDCHSIVVYAKDLPKSPPPQPMVMPTVEQVPVPQVPDLSEPTEVAVEQSAPRWDYHPQPIGRQEKMLYRAYQMAEYQRGGYGLRAGWLRYEAHYATVAQCWGAVKERVQQERDSVLQSYRNMAPSPQSVSWYQNANQSLTDRASKLSCVVAN